MSWLIQKEWAVEAVEEEEALGQVDTVCVLDVETESRIKEVFLATREHVQNVGQKWPVELNKCPQTNK